MGNGDSVLMPWLNSYLLGNKKATDLVISEVNKNEHPVPYGPKELQASQNLHLLEAGCRGGIYGMIPVSLENDLISRFTRERNSIGLWGSECTSPIYHHFTITGLTTIYHNTNNQALKDLIMDNLASFFWYALRMGLADSKHGLIGMRGTGHDMAVDGYTDLHFVCQYHTSGRPKDYTRLSSWKPMLKDSGWAFSGVAGGLNYELYKLVFDKAVDHSYTPWRLRSKLTFIEVDGHPAGHFYEKGINGNTPALLGYVHHENRYLPINSQVRFRQQQDNSQCTFSITPGGLGWMVYTGIYTGLIGGGKGGVQAIPIEIKYGTISAFSSFKTISFVVKTMSSSLDGGVTGWTQIYPSLSVPEPTPITTPPSPPSKPKASWIEKMGL